MNAIAQWQSFGYFDLNATSFYEDSSSNTLYIGGQFHFFNTDTVVGLGQYDGTTLNALGCGVGWDCENFYSNMLIEPTNEIIKYHDTIYVVGAFWYVNGQLMNGIAKWDGSNWIRVGTGLKGYYNDAGIGFNATILNDTLYVCGAFDSIAGVEAHGLAKYHGTTWSNVRNLPQFESYSDPNFIYGANFYDGELYVAGNIYDPDDPSKSDLIKWNGTEWVGTGNIDGANAAIYNMLIYKNELYISGDFNILGDPPIQAHNIARFDGTTWKTVGGGTDHQINDMRVFGDYLYIAGTFEHVDGMPIENIARWDGTRWCGYNSHFDNTGYAVGMFRDTLYLSGGFWSINGDSSLRKVVRWTGGDSLFQCGNPVGISEIQNEDDFNFSIFPNPTSDGLTLTTSVEGKLRISNELGQIIQTISIRNKQQKISTEQFPSGTYFITFQTDKTIQTNKIIIRH